MLESIYVGMTGLLGYSRGLRVIANNTANINTPGFKSSSIQFSDLFYTGGNLSGGNASRNQDQLGFGLNTTGTAISFKQGELRQTGNDLDLAVDGQGMFILKNADGQLSYTRAGQFKFDAAGELVSRVNGEKVMGLDSHGNFTAVSLAGQMLERGQPTSRIKLTGLLSNSITAGDFQPNPPTPDSGINVIDAGGVSHLLNPKSTTVTTGAGATLKFELLDGTTVVGSGNLAFADGKPTAATALVPITYAPPGQPPMSLTIDFSSDISFWAGAYGVKVQSQDGVTPGSLTGAVFDASGTLRMNYSNGRNIKGPRLALARFDSPDAVGAAGNNQFKSLDENAWHIGTAGEGAFGNVRSGQVEISNVDLSQEFSDLVVMQRGYQASSQVISTANEMLQQLFSMKGK